MSRVRCAEGQGVQLAMVLARKNTWENYDIPRAQVSFVTRCTDGLSSLGVGSLCPIGVLLAYDVTEQRRWSWITLQL